MLKQNKIPRPRISVFESKVTWALQCLLRRYYIQKWSNLGTKPSCAIQGLYILSYLPETQRVRTENNAHQNTNHSEQHQGKYTLWKQKNTKNQNHTICHLPDVFLACNWPVSFVMWLCKVMPSLMSQSLSRVVTCRSVSVLPIPVWSWSDFWCEQNVPDD